MVTCTRPVQDPVSQISGIDGTDLQDPSLTEVLGEGEALFFKDVTTGRFPMLPWMAPNPCTYGHH